MRPTAARKNPLRSRRAVATTATFVVAALSTVAIAALARSALVAYLVGTVALASWGAYVLLTIATTVPASDTACEPSSVVWSR